MQRPASKCEIDDAGMPISRAYVAQALPAPARRGTWRRIVDAAAPGRTRDPLDGRCDESWFQPEISESYRKKHGNLSFSIGNIIVAGECDTASPRTATWALPRQARTLRTARRTGVITGTTPMAPARGLRIGTHSMRIRLPIVGRIGRRFKGRPAPQHVRFHRTPAAVLRGYVPCRASEQPALGWCGQRTMVASRQPWALTYRSPVSPVRKRSCTRLRPGGITSPRGPTFPFSSTG